MSNDFTRPMEWWVREIARATGYREDNCGHRGDDYRFRCPAPNCPAFPGTLSLCVRKNGGDGVLVGCSKGCDISDIVRSLGEEYVHEEEGRDAEEAEEEDPVNWLGRIFRRKDEKGPKTSTDEEEVGKGVPSAQKSRERLEDKRVQPEVQGGKAEDIAVSNSSWGRGSPRRPSSLLKEASPQPQTTIVDEETSISDAEQAPRRTSRFSDKEVDVSTSTIEKKEPVLRAIRRSEMSKGFRIVELLERLEIDEGRSKPEKGEWWAFCPIYPETKASLHITKSTENPERGIIHRFGHEDKEYYAEFREWWESGQPADITVKKGPVTILKDGEPVDLRISARQWWEDYTHIPAEEWETWGARFTDRYVLFPSTHHTAVKRRLKGTKDITWEPKHAKSDVSWPEMPGEMPETIWFAEGESSMGVLRHLGKDAYTLMRSLPKNPRYWSSLEEDGLREIIYSPDVDGAGREKARSFEEQVESTSSIRFVIISLLPYLQARLDETDVRDLYIRAGADETKRILDDLEEEARRAEAEHIYQIEEFLAQSIVEQRWLVDRVWLAQSIGMVAGREKMGKTWWELELGLSIATGTSFLDEFEVREQGPVIYIAREDPRNVVWDRLARIMIAKGFGHDIDFDSMTVGLKPRRNIPMFIDINEDLFFNLGAVEAEVRKIREKMLKPYGYRAAALVILDPVLRMIGEETDLYRAEDVGRDVFENAADVFRRELGCSVLLSAHSPETKPGKPFGSISFSAFSKNTIKFRGEPPDEGIEGLWVEFAAQIGSEKSWRGWFRLTELSEGGYRSEFSKEKPTGFKISRVGRGISAKELILTYLRTELRGRRATVEEIAEGVGRSPDNTRTHLNALHREGKIGKERDEGELPMGGSLPYVYWFIGEFEEDVDWE
jgi:hypothetical protein